MRIGSGDVLVKLQITSRERESLIACVGEYFEELVENPGAQFTSGFHFALQIKRVQETRSCFAITAGDQESSDRDQLVLGPFDMSRGPRLFELYKNISAAVFRVICVIEQPHGDVKIGRIAPERFAQFVTVRTIAVIALEEVVKVFRQLARPEWIEGLLVNFLGLLHTAHVLEQRSLDLDQLIVMLRKVSFVLAYEDECLVVVVIVDESFLILLDDFIRRRIVNYRLLVETWGEIFFQAMRFRQFNQIAKE